MCRSLLHCAFTCCCSACLLLYLRLSYIPLSYLILSDLTLPYLTLPYLTLPYLTSRLYLCRHICYHAPSICICSQYGAFKESICSALERSSRAVEDAKTSMDELADQAELIVQVAVRNLIFYLPPLLPSPARTATAMRPIDLLNELFSTSVTSCHFCWHILASP